MNLDKYTIWCDGGPYDTCDDLAQAKQRARSWQDEIGGLWQVFEKRQKNGIDTNLEMYSIGPTKITYPN